jgi:hypothetical protein
LAAQAIPPSRTALDPLGGALIQEKGSGALFAIDSSAGANGENPAVQAAASFYEPDTRGDNTPSETGLATANSNGEGPAQGTDGLTAMLQRMEALG